MNEDSPKGRAATLQEKERAENAIAVYVTSFVCCMQQGVLRLVFLDSMTGDAPAAARVGVALPAVAAVGLYDALGKVLQEAAGATPEMPRH